MNDDSNYKERTVYDPICGIAKYVRFSKSGCPFSKEKCCDDCVMNEFDRYAIAALLELDDNNYIGIS